MRILGLSDLHGNLLETIPKCDVLCLCGDIIPLNIQRNNQQSEYWWKNKFTSWINKIDCKEVIVVPGNHDFYFEWLYCLLDDNNQHTEYDNFCNLLNYICKKPIHILINDSVTINNITFYGCPFVQPIGGWAFEYTTHKQIEIPKCDILLTHDSPIKNHNLEYYGTGKSKYWLYGHWHDGESDYTKNWYNCSRLDDRYCFKKNYKYVLIDINMPKTTFEILQEFAEEIKNYAASLLDSETEYDNFCHKVDEIFIKYIDNPKDTEDEIPWTDSSIINDMEDQI